MAAPLLDVSRYRAHAPRRACIRSRSCSVLPGLRDDVNKRSFAALDPFDGATQRRAEILWIRDGTFCVETHASGQCRVIDIGIRRLRYRFSRW